MEFGGTNKRYKAFVTLYIIEMSMLVALLSTFALNISSSNSCVSFQVSPGAGCAWMCNYCTSELGPMYYFTTDVCKYEPGGCVGNPLLGVQYTCCSL